MPGKYQLSTLGCKVNQYESQVIRRILDACGWRPAAEDGPCDLVIVNSCAVTASAMNDNCRTIRRSARRTPSVFVVGCGASADPARLRSLPHVQAILGHDVDLGRELPRLLANLERSQGLNRSTIPGNHSSAGRHQAPADASIRSDAGGQLPSAPASAARLPSNRIIPVLGAPVKNHDTLAERIESFEGHQRAFLKVQDGCDAHCTYCIIPRLRREVRWKPVSLVMEEASQLVAGGHKEIVLTGIFLGAYGRSTAIRRRMGRSSSPLAELVACLANIAGLKRLRLSSLEPGDVDEALLEVLATRGACVPHLHLPLQSASPAILRRMNRQYTREDFLDMVGRVRKALDHPAVTTDVIVGFPGETDADFDATVQVARSVEFCKIHAFPFSPRSGTAAARWQSDFIPSNTVRDRMKRLADLDSETSYAYRRQLVDKPERVIVEGSFEGATDEAGPAGKFFWGRADRYFEVCCTSSAPLWRGDLVPVMIDRVTPTRTHASSLDGRPLKVTLPMLTVAPQGSNRAYTLDETHRASLVDESDAGPALGSPHRFSTCAG